VGAIFVIPGRVEPGERIRLGRSQRVRLTREVPDQRSAGRLLENPQPILPLYHVGDSRRRSPCARLALRVVADRSSADAKAE
jgi:hypothetical protein